MATEGDLNDDDIYAKALHDELETSEAGSIAEVLTRTELDLAYSSKKVLNLGILLMHVATRANDYETSARENGEISSDAMEKTFELDILSGILDSEVNELDCFISSIQKEVLDAHENSPLSVGYEMSFEDIQKKLQNAEETLKQSKDQISEIKMQAAKLVSTSTFHGQEAYTKWKMQTVEQQRHTLQMLERSLGRELDLEKRLADTGHNEEEIKLKLHHVEQEAYLMEEEVAKILERLFEAENAAEVLKGISKELVGKIQVVQFNLNGSMHRESKMRHKLDKSMLNLSDAEHAIQKLKTLTMNLDTLAQQANDLQAAYKIAEEKCVIANEETLYLREKVNSLEDKLRESNILLQQAKESNETNVEQQNMLNAELIDMENIILDLRENLFEAENRVESAEAKCRLLGETNLELNEELGYLKSNETEKANSLEMRLKESDTRLQHAKASVEATEEQQSMLYSALSDMENVIEDLKENVSRAEKRAESAESKCFLLTETNLELNEELASLRRKLESLERNLHQTDNAKIATANDIGIKTKVISNLVVKLALERERLQSQIKTLRKENKILMKKCWKTNDFGHADDNGNGKEFALKPSEVAATEFSTSNVKNAAAAVSTFEDDAVSTTSREGGGPAVDSKLMPMRSIDVGQLKLKHIVLALLILLVALLGVYVFQAERCPF